MEKVKKIFFSLFFFGSVYVLNSQTEIVRQGLVKGMATISPGKMFGYNESYFYLHGNLEGYLSKKVSVSGDGYMFLGEQSKSPEGFKYINNLFFGLYYHVVKGNGDIFFGGQPGVCIAQLRTDSPKVPVAHTGTSPLFSAVAGCNYFVGKYFNFFVQARYIAGSHNYDLHKDLSEIRISAGLGFNINTMKAK